MKHLIAVSTTLLLAGCATGALSDNPPYYDRNHQALIGEGFPVERIDMPRGFEFADVYAAERTQAHDSPGDQGTANLTEAGVSWLNRTGNTAIITAMHQSAAQGSHWLPWAESDGFEFVGNMRVQYGMYSGQYTDVTADASSVPSAAPDCAVSTHLLAHSINRRKRTIMTYTEGMPCDELSRFGGSAEQELRQRAYRAFSLTR